MLERARWVVGMGVIASDRGWPNEETYRNACFSGARPQSSLRLASLVTLVTNNIGVEVSVDNQELLHLVTVVGRVAPSKAHPQNRGPYLAEYTIVGVPRIEGTNLVSMG